MASIRSKVRDFAYFIIRRNSLYTILNTNKQCLSRRRKTD